MAADTDLKYYKSAAVNDTPTNGGRISANEVVSNTPSNLFAAVGGSELAAGSTKLRKMFAKWIALGSTLAFVKAFLDKYTLGDDIVTFIAATATNTQGDVTGSEKQYGCGKLNATVVAAATSMQVLVEDGANHTFLTDDLVRITDKVDVDDLAGNEEYVTITGAPGVVGDVVTFSFTPPLAFGYGASVGRVMNVYEPPDMAASVTDFNLTSAAGTFNVANLHGNNIGSVEQVVTGTFNSPTTFSLVGDTLGSLGAGNIGGGAAPVNPANGEPFFVMEAAGFGGTFANGNVFTFNLHASGFAVFFIKDIPPGTVATTPNKFTFATTGETPPE